MSADADHYHALKELLDMLCAADKIIRVREMITEPGLYEFRVKKNGVLQHYVFPLHAAGSMMTAGEV